MKAIILTLILSSIAVANPGPTFTIDPQSPLYHKVEIIEVLSGNTLLVEFDKKITEIQLIGIRTVKGWEAFIKESLEIEVQEHKDAQFSILFEENKDGILKKENDIPLVYLFKIDKGRFEVINATLTDPLNETVVLAKEHEIEIPFSALCVEIVYPVQSQEKAPTTWAHLKRR